MQKQLVTFDWAIKKLLRSKANFGILEGFLSELLAEGKELKIVELLETESNQETPSDKFNRVDILAKLDGGELVLIEVQANREADFLHRMLFGTSKVVIEHMALGTKYAEIKKIYSVNILYFDLGHGQDYIYHGTTSFEGIHKHDQLQLSENQKKLYQKEKISEIYPEYYLLKVNNFDDLAKNSLDEWMYFLKNEEIKGNFSAKGLQEAKTKLDVMKLPEQERKAYERYLDHLHYEASMVGSNFDEGKLEGEKLGLEKGEKLGLEKGMREVAKKMKDDGLASELIKRITGLDIVDIEKL